MIKRLFDLILAIVLGMALLPALIVIAAAVKLEDGGSVFYRQQRVGRRGKPFFIWKFRSMHVDSDRAGPPITAAGDPRITAVGRILRKWKLDELPQLINVITGEMSFVGPRPEVERYVSKYTLEQRRVLDLRPGITDLASIAFRYEEELLAKSADPEKFYCQVCIPRKIELNLAHAEKPGFWKDLGVIARTVVAVILSRGSK
jgi:lipopolysaccharide/colanic/teichoic acid biosynthesis glycosyltransferase